MENVINKIMSTRNEGAFDEFYSIYLEDAEEELTRILDRSYNFSFDKEKLIFEALCSLKNSLMDKGAKTLFAELQIFKDRSGDECTYKDFVDYIGNDEFHIYFNEKYIILKELLDKKVGEFLDLYRECISRLSIDCADIEAVFGMEVDFIEKISFDVDSDTHNGGKSVVKVVTGDGNVLFYKPHSLAMDVIFNDIMVMLLKRLDNFEYEHIKTLDRGEYGWQEKVEYHESGSINDIKNYYYSVGVTLAIFYILGTEDIHAGNLISKGNMPAYVDLEVLLSNKNKRYAGTSENDRYWNLKKVFVDSVLGTYILPNNTPTSLIDIDICALTSGQSIGEESEKLSYFDLADKGTLNIHFEKKNSEAYESLSNVKFNKTIVEADAYIEEITEGFKDAYKVVVSEKKNIAKILDKHSDAGIRQVVRATYVYGKFLDAAYHPKYLQSAGERKRVISLIHGNSKRSGKMSQIADKEIEMLYGDDIPYFYTRYDSHDLFCKCDGKENVVESVYTDTLKESVHKKLSSLSEQDMYNQIGLIYASFANFGKHRIKNIRNQNEIMAGIAKKEDDRELPERYIKAIFDDLKSKCLEADDICSMVGFEPDIKDKYRISYLSGNLYNGLGVIYFMALADKKFGGKNSDVILKLVKGIETINPYKRLPGNIASSFNGLSGRLYVYDRIYDLTGCGEYREYYDRIVEYLADTGLSQDDVLDYVTGVCGGIVAIINLYYKNKDKRLLGIIEKYAAFIKEKIEHMDHENVLNGMAHGYSGFATALFKIYGHCKDKYFYDKAVEFVLREDASYSEKEGNWKDTRSGKYDMVFWCHGAAGIGLSRISTIKYIEHDKKLLAMWKRDIRSAIDAVKRYGTRFEQKHGLCHGLMGNLLILDHMAEKTNDSDLKAFVREKLCMFLSRLKTDAINYENALNAEDVGFMLGLSGIGYSIMKLTDEKISNILLFEGLEEEQG